MSTGPNDPLRNQNNILAKFFRDPNRPVQQKIAACFGLFVVFWLLLSPLFSSNRRRTDGSDLAQSFPSGPSGLKDSNAQGDKLRALAVDMSKRSERDEASESPQSADLPEGASEQTAEDTESERQTRAAELSDSVDAQNIGPLVAIPKKVHRPVAILQNSEGKLVVAHREGITLFDKQALVTPRILLDADLYDREFNDDFPLITSVALLPEDKLWVGFANGQLMRYSRFQWSILSRPFEMLKRHVSAIGGDENGTFIGSRGLFQWDTSFKRLIGDEELKDMLITSIASSSKGQLFFGSTVGLFAYDRDNHKWNLQWKIPSQEKTIYAISPSTDGSALIGTNNGLIRVSKKGVITDRMLLGEQITILKEENGGTIWAGTARNGLRYYDGEQWYHAGAAEGVSGSVTSLLFEASGQMWLGVDKLGVYSASVAEVRQWIKGFKDKVVSEEKVEIFSDACAAAAKLLAGINDAGDVSVETVDGQMLVFFHGKLQCPAKQLGFRRADGVLTLVRDWNVTVFAEGGRKDIAIPKEIPADRFQSVLLDSKDRLWFGSNGTGVYLVEQDRWQTYGADEQFDENPVEDILEDPSGNIWFATNPPFNEEARKYLRPNLHLFNEKGWFHFDPKNGVIFYGSYGLALNKNGSLVLGTNAGISIIDGSANIVNYGKDQGLERRFAFSVAVDRSDRIWVAHQFFGNGITILDSQSIRNIDSSNGLFNDRISYVAHDRNKRVWLLASNGMVAVYPASFFEKNSTTVSVNQRAVRPRNMFEQRD